LGLREKSLTPKWSEAGRDKILSGFFCFKGRIQMKKVNTKISYKAYDGNFYSVMLRDWPKAQAREYLIKAYGYNVSFPIKYLDCTWKSEQWKFLEIKKADSAGEAVPIVRVGDGKPRCPYCWDRKCLINSFSKDIPNIDYPEPDEADDAVKYFGYKRFIGQCLNPRNQGKYFLAEYKESYKTSMEMLAKKQCPLCRSHESLSVVELKNTGSDKISFGVRENGVSKEIKSMIVNVKGIEYRCRACNANASMFFKDADKNEHFAKLKEVYFKK